MEVLEPNASSIEDRTLTMIEAAARGLRTYAMFCPLLPGIADSPDQIDRLVKLAVEFRAEEIFAELINPRGRGLRLCQEALELWGYEAEAKAIGAIRKQAAWSAYVVKPHPHGPEECPKALGHLQAAVPTVPQPASFGARRGYQEGRRRRDLAWGGARQVWLTIEVLLRQGHP